MGLNVERQTLVLFGSRSSTGNNYSFDILNWTFAGPGHPIFNDHCRAEREGGSVVLTNQEMELARLWLRTCLNFKSTDTTATSSVDT